jgi:hypothetical protein
MFLRKPHRWQAGPAILALLSSNAAWAQQTLPKFEVGVQFSSLSLQRPTQIIGSTFIPGAVGVAPGVGSRTEPGIGGRFTYNLTDNVALEAEGNLFPRSEGGAPFGEAPLGMPGGRIFQGKFGVKAGKRFRRFGIFARARPGFIGFTRVNKLLSTNIVNNPPPQLPFTVGTFGVGKDVYFSMDLGGTIEYYPRQRVFARFDVGDTIVHYETFHASGAFLSRAIIVRGPETNHNFQFSTGIGFRF